MDKKLKKALEDVFRAPEPAGKRAFLKQYRRRELGSGAFLLTQIAYIRWLTWAMSVLLFGGAFVLAAGWDGGAIWMAAALTPFLALLAVAENGKSRLYGMEELELACRVSLRSVALARMVILGLFHLILLGALTPVMAIWGAVDIVRAGVYLLTPYLLTAVLGLECTRRIRGREALLACGASAALVSAFGLLAVTWRPVLYQPEKLPLWGGVLTIAAFATMAELMLKVKEAEELQWN